MLSQFSIYTVKNNLSIFSVAGFPENHSKKAKLIVHSLSYYTKNDYDSVTKVKKKSVAGDAKQTIQSSQSRLFRDDGMKNNVVPSNKNVPLMRDGVVILLIYENK